MSKTEALSRRKLLGRIGVLAAAGYSVPALTTLSMAQAGSGPSGGNRGGDNDDIGGDDDNGGTIGAGGTNTKTDPAVVLATCGPQNLNDPVYLQCLVDHGFSI
jgi:hypothetical protein